MDLVLDFNNIEFSIIDDVFDSPTWQNQKHLNVKKDSTDEVANYKVAYLNLNNTKRRQPEVPLNSNSYSIDKELLKIETSLRDDVYGFTLNPDPKCIIKVRNKRYRVEQVPGDVLQEWLFDKIKKSRVWQGSNKLDVNIKYFIFPEISQSGKLHWHGIIYNCCPPWALAIKAWCNRCITRGMGMKLEMRISKVHEWLQYITKEYGISGLKYRSYVKY